MNKFPSLSLSLSLSLFLFLTLSLSSLSLSLSLFCHLLSPLVSLARCIFSSRSFSFSLSSFAPSVASYFHHSLHFSTNLTISTSLFFSLPQVVFSLYLDEKTNKEVAKNVRLTDEPIPGMSGDQTGILDVVVLR